MRYSNYSVVSKALSFTLAVAIGLSSAIPASAIAFKKKNGTSTTPIVKIKTATPALPAFRKQKTTTGATVLHYTMANGHQVYIQENHNQPIVTIDTWVDTGSVNETEENNGVSHFLEHLLFKGTPSHPAGEFERIIESYGAHFNAATSDDYTHYYITIHKDAFEKALGLHSDMLLNASIPADELERERLVVQEEINRSLDNPQRQLFMDVTKNLYGDHTYALDTLGPKEVIATIPRKAILDYYHYWYQPQNFRTVVVGDVDPKEVQKLIAEKFKHTPFKKPKSLKVPTVTAPKTPDTYKLAVIQNPNVSQSYSILSFMGPSIKNRKDMYALDLAFMALGDGKSSRLYKKLVETKTPLALSVSAGNMTQKHAGILYVSAAVKPKNLTAAKESIFKILRDAKENGITEKEIEKAKTQVVTDFVKLNETTSGVANSIGYAVSIGNLNDYANYVDELQKVSTQDVQKALSEYLKFHQLVLVELLPEKDVDLKAEQKDSEQLIKAEGLIDDLTQPAPTSVSAADSEAETATTVAEAKVEAITLDNGMRIILKELPTADTVAVRMFVNGGDSTESIPGTASLLATMLSQGTESRSASQISEALESRGMSISASSTSDYMMISAHSLSKDTGELFNLLTDIVTRPALDKTELTNEKDRLKQGILANREKPTGIAFENLTLNMFPSHPYGHTGQKILDTLDQVNQQTLRNYYNRVLRPHNITVAVVGRFDGTTIQHYLNTMFKAPVAVTAPTNATAVAQAETPSENADTTTAEPSAEKTVDASAVEIIRSPKMKTALQLPPAPVLSESKTLITEKDQQAAVWVARGWLGPNIAAKDYPTLKVINALLGTGMSSRLFVGLREKQGLAYAVGSMYPSKRQQSPFIMYIGTDPKNKEAVLRGFDHEIKKLLTQPLTEQELEEAQNKVKGSFALAHETPLEQAFYLGFYEVLGKGYTYDVNYPDAIDTVTIEDVQRVAKTYFEGPSITAIVQPTVKTADKTVDEKTKPSSSKQ